MLAPRLINDESTRCRKLAGLALHSLLEKVSDFISFLGNQLFVFFLFFKDSRDKFVVKDACLQFLYCIDDAKHAKMLAVCSSKFDIKILVRVLR